jgi:hypothetical protein
MSQINNMIFHYQEVLKKRLSKTDAHRGSMITALLPVLCPQQPGTSTICRQLEDDRHNGTSMIRVTAEQDLMPC